MPAQGRKNVRGKTGVRFKAAYTTSKNKSMLRNVVTELIIHDHVKVTKATADQAKRIADKMVTLAKRGDLHARRQAASFLRTMTVPGTETLAIDKLFNELGPRFAARQGGYTRVLKLGERRGDGAPISIIVWTD